VWCVCVCVDVTSVSDDFFTIASSSGANGTSYGVYQPRTPHSLQFSLNEQLGDKELVAAVYANGDALVFSTGVRGTHAFARQDADFVANDARIVVPDTIEGGSHDLLGEQAPLAFLKERAN
jgi:hypothetical protein